MNVPGQASRPALRVLAVVATPREATRLVRALHLGGGAEVCRVTTPAELRRALADGQWDAVLCAADVPSLPISVAFDICADRRGTVPFVALLGARDEALATGLLGQGVHNWVRRDRPALIAAVVERELREARIRAAMEQADAELRALLDIARAAGAAEDFRDALAKALALICRLGDWDYGESWSLDAASGELRLLPEWVGDPARFSDFRAATAAILDPAGKGFIARVWSQGCAEWLADLSDLGEIDNEHVMLRLRAAHEAGLGAGFAVPIRNAGSTLAVMAFFVDAPRQANESFVSIAEATAAQLGGVVARLHALDEAAASRRQLEAVADNLPGLIFQRVMRPDGTVHYPFFGGRGEGMLAYARQDYPSLDAAFPFVHPDDRPRVVAAVKASVANLEPFVGEHRNVRPGGEVRWVEVHAATRRLADDSIVWDGVAVDVTERHDAEAERDEDRRRLEVIAANLPGLIYQRIALPDGTVRYPVIGGAAAGVFDIDRARTYGSVEEAFAFVHPDDRAAVLEINRISQRELKPFAAEYRALAPDGSIHWIEVRALPRRLEDGGTAWEGVAVDATARHEAVAALAAARNHIETIVDNIPGLLFRRTHRPDGSVAHVQIVGHSVATGTAPMKEYASVEESLDFAHPDDIGYVVGALAASQRDLAPYHAEFRVLLAGGGNRWVEARALPRREADGSTTWDGVALDVTARHAVEAELAAAHGRIEAIVGNIPGLLFSRTHRPDGSVVHEQIVGNSIETGVARNGAYPSVEASLIFVHPDDVPAIVAELRASERDLVPYHAELRVLTAEGEVRWVEARALPRRDPDGSTTWTGIALDVTARHEAEAELAESRRQMESLADSIPGLMFRRVLRLDGTVSFPYLGGALLPQLGARGCVYPSLADSLYFVHPDDRAFVLASIEASIEDLAPFSVAYRAVGGEGGERWLESRVQPRREADGSIVWDGVAVDVTGRHTAEAELADSRRRIAAIAENVPGLIYRRVRHPDGRYSYPYVSRSPSIPVSGHVEPQVAVRALDFVHGADRDRVLAGLEASARDLVAFQSEFRVVDDDGTEYWVESRSLPRRLPDGGTEWDGLAVDVSARHKAEQEASESRRRIEAIAGSVPGMLFERVMLPDGRMYHPYTSGTATSLFLVHRDEPVPPDRALGFVHPDEREEITAAIVESARTLAPSLLEYRMVASDGAVRWIESRSMPRRMADGGTLWYGVAIDVTARREAEDALADSRRLFAAVAQNVPVVLYRRVLTADGRMHYTYVSRDLSMALRSGGGPMPADEAMRFIHEADRPVFLDRLLASARDLAPFECEFRVVAPDGRTHWIETRSLPHRLGDGGTEWDGIAIDVTGRHEAEERATWLARYDQLTGLPNRALFEDFARRGIQEAGGGNEQLAVLLVGLDRFRLINETLGQAAGDAVLRAIGQRLDSRIGERSVVARQSGDEYLVLLREEGGVEAVSNRLRDMLGAVVEPVDVEGETVFVTASIGAAMYPDDGVDPASLIKHAELALHEAKATGPATCRFFTATLDARAQERFAMQARLRRAIDEDEFAVYYQPQIDLVSGRIVGAEALVRWRQGTRIELPGRFVPLAEETGLIVPLGRRVLQRACADWAERFGGENEVLDLSVNVSARQMADDGFLDMLRETLRDSGLDAGRLKLEITESALMAQDEQAMTVMRTLQDLGIRLAVDDFGTGYSSLQYLARLPVETLKVDQSFVRVMAENREAASIVQAIIDMAHRLDMGACAEGVETAEQEIFLRAYGCDACQGFLYAPALPIDEFVAYYRQGTT